MRVGSIDFNAKALGSLPVAEFNKHWKECKFEEKTGKKSEDAHKELKAEKTKIEKAEKEKSEKK
jgi:hypothetical protein